MSSSEIKDPSGDPQTVLSPIEERKDSQKHRIEGGYAINSFFRAVNDGAKVVDHVGKILLVNEIIEYIYIFFFSKPMYLFAFAH